jgi:TonB family protein
MNYRFCFALISLLLLIPTAPAKADQEIIKLAVLDFGASSIGRGASQTLATNIKSSGAIVLDQDLTRAAAKGNNYDGSLNLTRQQARDLGSTLGTPFYLLGDAQTLRRSASGNAFYFESYASVFLVSGRTGKLLMWDRLAFEGADTKQTELQLLTALKSRDFSERLIAAMHRAQTDELNEVVLVNDPPPVIEEAPDEKAAEALGLQLPRPFRRLRPAYPETAKRAEAEATVDVVADIDDKGDVTKVEVERWAGFGLDTATVDTVRQIRFFPALKNGTPIPIRVMLRYNFRKPPVN